MSFRFFKLTRKPMLLALVMILAGFMIVASKPTHTYGENTAPSDANRVSPTSTASAHQSFTYSGKRSEWVRRLLTRVGGWQCPANDEDSGTPPKVNAGECIRDTYVAAAVLYAWAAECYARSEQENKAQAAAEQMYEQLKAAQSLCSDAPSFGQGRECETVRIYKCGEL